MATEILRPNSSGDEILYVGQYPAEGEHWDKVDDVTPDGYSTYISVNDNTTDRRALFNLPSHSVGSGTINSITIYFLIDTSAKHDTSAHPSQKSGTTVTDGAQVYEDSHDDQFHAYSEIFTTNPATSSAYTWEEIDALQIGVTMHFTGPGGPACCTQVYVVINYEPAPPAVGNALLFGSNF